LSNTNLGPEAQDWTAVSSAKPVDLDKDIWLVVLPILKNISQWEGLSIHYGK
jgi:hypothetical protein